MNIEPKSSEYIDIYLIGFRENPVIDSLNRIHIKCNIEDISNGSQTPLLTEGYYWREIFFRSDENLDLYFETQFFCISRLI